MVTSEILMIQKYLLCILIALTFIQSIDAVADAAKFHQPNSEYAEADYFPNKVWLDSSHNSESPDLDENSPKQNNDVDHCCSCHGVTTMLFLSNELFLKTNLLQNEIANFAIRYLSHLITPDIRPPIV